MSQRARTVDIDGKKYTVYELTVRQIRQVIDELDQLDNEKALEVLSMCSDVTLPAMEEMAPSDIRTLWDAWAEANKDFLHLIRQAMKRPPVQQMIDSLLSQILTDVFADLPSAGTAPPVGTTGGDSSGPRSIFSQGRTGSANASVSNT